MPQYKFQISVSASRIKDEEPDQEPGKGLGEATDEMARVVVRTMKRGFPPFSSRRTAGSLSLEKAVTVQAESFAALAEVLGKFDALAEQLEIESQVKHS